MFKYIIVAIGVFVLAPLEIRAMDLPKSTDFFAAGFDPQGQFVMANVPPSDQYARLEEWHVRNSDKRYFLSRALYSKDQAILAMRQMGRLGHLTSSPDNPWYERFSCAKHFNIALYYVHDVEKTEPLAYVFLPPTATEIAHGSLCIAIPRREISDYAWKTHAVLCLNNSKISLDVIRTWLLFYLEIENSELEIIANEKYSHVKNQVIENVCSWCGKPNKKIKCRKCKAVKYCTVACLNDGKKIHEKFCQQARAIKPPAIKIENMTLEKEATKNASENHRPEPRKKARARGRDTTKKGRSDAPRTEKGPAQIIESGEGGHQEASAETQKIIVPEHSQDKPVKVCDEIAAHNAPFESKYGNPDTKTKKTRRVRIPNPFKKVWHDTRKNSRATAVENPSIDDAASESFFEVTVSATEASMSLSECETSLVSEEYPVKVQDEITRKRAIDDLIAYTKANFALLEAQDVVAIIDFILDGRKSPDYFGMSDADFNAVTRQILNGYMKENYPKLFKATNKKGIKCISDIFLSKAAIVDTLATLQKHEKIEITQCDKKKITANKKKSQTFLNIHTTHPSGLNQDWAQPAAVQAHVREFYGECDLLIHRFWMRKFSKN